MKILVCLPALNERESIDGMIAEIKKLNFDIVVSDAGSNDGTDKIAEDMGVKVLRRSAPGKGVGVREAISFADSSGYDFLVTIDCDNTYPVNSIPELLAAAPGADLVLGARNYSKISNARRWANQIHNLLFAGFLK